jgi:cephalosporin hydroxylase
MSDMSAPVQDPLHDIFHTTFFGLRAIQHWSDVVLWELFFEEQGGLKAVLELGSGGHGLSIIFALHAVTRGFQLYTFDRRRYQSLDWPLPKLLNLEKQAQVVDLFSEAGAKRVLQLLAKPELHPLLLFCDDGDKPREFATFAPHLRPGDYVGVHDWGLEFYAEDVLPMQGRVEPWRFDLADRMGGSTRMWKVREVRA